MEAINIYAMLVTWKKNKKGECPIAISFDINSKRVGLQNIKNQRVPSDFWDSNRRVVKTSYPNASLINAVIEKKLHHHREFILKRQALEMTLNAAVIKQYLAGKLVDFYTYAQDVIDNKKLDDGEGYSEDTKRRYRDEIKRMQQYQESLQFNQITVKFLESYKLWLQNTYRKKDQKKLHKNSIWKALGFIRMVYNQAVKDEIILNEDNPFKKFEVGSYEENYQKIKYLELNQVQLIEKALLEKLELLDQLTISIGYRFLAMCVLGMRISDAMRLNEAFLNDAGQLDFKPHKTRRYNNTAVVPIQTDRQKKYLQETLRRPLPETDPKSFRTTFNNHLKILAAAAGVPMITSHAGRHTMGSLLIDAGIDKPAAKKMLGVKSDRTFDVYAHLKQSKLLSEAQKLNNVM